MSLLCACVLAQKSIDASLSLWTTVLFGQQCALDCRATYNVVYTVGGADYAGTSLLAWLVVSSRREVNRFSSSESCGLFSSGSASRGLLFYCIFSQIQESLAGTLAGLPYSSCFLDVSCAFSKSVVLWCGKSA